MREICDRDEIEKGNERGKRTGKEKEERERKEK